MSVAVLLAFALATVAAPAPAEQPPIANARLDSASAAGGLEAAVRGGLARAGGPGWIGWAVAKVAGDGQACCWNDEGRGCGLEGQRAVAPAPAVRTVKLEGPTQVTVLLRVEQGAVGKIRAFSIDCPLDAGGLPMRWLTDVKPAESVALLLRFASAGEPGKDPESSPETDRRKATGEPAVHALAMHAAGEAQAALEKLAASAPAPQIRRSAMFWLASTRGQAGYQVVSRLAREDPSEKVREHAVFALTQSHQPEAIPAIVRVAREDRSPQVRKRAMFWLGQSRDPRAFKFFEEVLSR